MTESHALRLAQDRHDRRTCERCDDDDSQVEVCDTDWGRMCAACYFQVCEEGTE